MRLGLFGCYDAGAPRLATLLAGWEALGGTVAAVHEPGFAPGTRGREAIARAPWRHAPGRAAAQARLWRRRHALADVDALLVPYPGHAEMPLARRVADALGKPLIFDPFLSLFDTAVGDRALFAPTSSRAWALRALDRLALRLADRVLADTPAMADYYRALARLSPDRLVVVPVGADGRRFAPAPGPAGPPYEVLCVGHMLPLHGVETILEAARRLADRDDVRFHLVGTGPVDVAARLADPALARVRWTPGVPYEALPALYAGAHVCLGAFGPSEKAARVVPHKVYEAVASGRAVVTRDGPAAREAFGDTLALVPAGDAGALAGAIAALLADPAGRASRVEAALAVFRRRFDAPVLARVLADAVRPGG